MYNITHKLVEEVLKIRIHKRELSIFNDRIDFVYVSEIGLRNKIINIHEFAHLCKEYMKKSYIYVWSGNGYSKDIGYECSITHFMSGDIKTFKSDTEVGAIFDATYSLINGEVNFGD